jgi:hypothetical protein
MRRIGVLALVIVQLLAGRAFLAAESNDKRDDGGRDHWSIRAPLRPDLPHVRGEPSNPVDAFLAAELQKQGLVPQSAAGKGILLRRLYLDLVGVPPTRAEREAFLADLSPDAYEKVVDRLLASPQYGERWGRHWMDVWRYSDWWGLGAEVRNSQKHIWHWRDWIIESLNSDKGYDQMVREMLAADELFPNDLGRLRATGFLVRNYFRFNRNSWLDDTVEHTSKAFLGLTMNCARCHEHKFDPIPQADYYRLRAFFEPYQVRTDELPGEADLEKDGLPRVFDCNVDAPTYLFERGDEKQPEKSRLLVPGVPAVLGTIKLDIQPVKLPPEAHVPGLRPFVLQNHLHFAERQLAAARETLRQAQKVLADIEQAEQAAAGMVEQARLTLTLAEKAELAAETQIESLKASALADLARAKEPPASDAAALTRQAANTERKLAIARADEQVARAALEVCRAEPAKKAEADKKLTAARDDLAKAQKAAESSGDAYTQLRGSVKSPESNLESEESRQKPFPATSSGRRTALAQWLTDRRHPLTARVAVNHLWARHFGRPLVATVFDFGRKGAAPTHPELLDYLAVELIESGWSMKHLHRLLVTSDAYRRTSSAAGAAANNLVVDPENRYYWRRDAIHMEAEVLRDSMLWLAGVLDTRQGGPPLDPTTEADARRRSLYFFHSHNVVDKFLSSFDEASVLECYRRSESIVPQQALALSNSALTLTMAELIASGLSEQLGEARDSDFVRAAFALLLAAEPSEAERSECDQALGRLTEVARRDHAPDPVRRARARLLHALLNHNDFITVR